jgi:hypothetical protein
MTPALSPVLRSHRCVEPLAAIKPLGGFPIRVTYRAMRQTSHPHTDNLFSISLPSFSGFTPTRMFSSKATTFTFPGTDGDCRFLVGGERDNA